MTSSKYVSRFQYLWYGIPHPLYDVMTRWAFLPLGGEAECRRQFVEWAEARPGDRVLSLCCGTGATERAPLAAVPDARVVGLDLGAGQIARAQAQDRSHSIDYCVADAVRTGLPDASFDRVLIVLALHEMPRAVRLDVLREARRLCRPAGRVIAVEHSSSPGAASRAIRWLWWFGWLPGNPETATTRDLQRHGLATEMKEAGLRVIERRVTRPAWIEGVAGEP